MLKTKNTTIVEYIVVTFKKGLKATIIHRHRHQRGAKILYERGKSFTSFPIFQSFTKKRTP